MGDQEQIKATELVTELVTEEKSLYQGFVQEVGARRQQSRGGSAVGRYAQVWVVPSGGTGPDADYHLTAFGDPDVVQEIGDALNSRYDYQGKSPQPMTPDREAEVMGRAMFELVEDTNRQAPHVLPRFFGFLDQARLAAGLPEPPGAGGLVQAEEAFLQGVEGELGNALEGFAPGSNTRHVPPEGGAEEKENNG